MKELRQSMLAETEITATKRRFGLFSQPPSIAIGDSSYFSSKTGSLLSMQLGKVRTGSP